MISKLLQLYNPAILFLILGSRDIYKKAYYSLVANHKNLEATQMSDDGRK